MTKKRKLIALILALILIGMSMLSGCNKAADNQKDQVITRGVSDSEIVVGTIQPLTGPVAFYSAVGKGVEAYFKYVNENGGVNGRKIRLVIEDDQAQPAQTVARARKLVEEDKVFAFVATFGTLPNLAIRDYLAQNQVPTIAPTTGSAQLSTPPNKYFFTLMTNYYGEGGAHVKYAAEQLKAKKIAVAYQNDDTGKEAFQGLKDSLAKYPLQLVGDVNFQMTSVDLSAEALKLKSSGAEVLMLYGASKVTATLIKEMAKIGYKPQILLWGASMTDTMFDLGGQDFDGVMGSQFVPNPASDDPKVVKLRETVKKYYPNEPATNTQLHMAGWNGAMIFVEGLKRAGKNLTVDSFIAAMETFKDWDGGLTAPVTYTPTRRQGQNSVKFLKADVKTKTFVILTDYISLEK